MKYSYSHVILFVIFAGVVCQSQTIYFSAYKPAPNDPLGFQQFGLSQVRLVSNAVGALPDEYRMNLMIENIPVTDEPVVSLKKFREQFAQYKTELTKDDTFIFYYHGHGTKQGIPLGNGQMYLWKDLADDVLELPAGTVIAMVMTCHSGCLADTLKSEPFKQRWENRKADGRNFVVLTAVNNEQIASARIIDGVRENPFTYAVRTAFSGKADGFINPDSETEKDGKTTLGEFVDYILFTTRQKSTKLKLFSKFDPQLAASCDEDSVLTCFVDK